MPREEVIALLGEPTDCPVPEAQCYYVSDKRDGRGYTITLVVEYRHYAGADDVDKVLTGRLEEYSLFPVGE
jgi:hypothetical protein